MKLPLNKAYGIVPTGCDPSLRPQAFLKSFPVGPCNSITIDATGFNHRYDDPEEAAVTAPRLDWMSKNCTGPFAVELVMGTLVHVQSGVPTGRRKRIVRVAFSDAADEAAYQQAFGEAQA